MIRSHTDIARILDQISLSAPSSVKAASDRLADSIRSDQVPDSRDIGLVFVWLVDRESSRIEKKKGFVRPPPSEIPSAFSGRIDTFSDQSGKRGKR